MKSSPFIPTHHRVFLQTQKPFNFSRNLSICYLASTQPTVALKYMRAFQTLALKTVCLFLFTGHAF